MNTVIDSGKKKTQTHIFLSFLALLVFCSANKVVCQPAVELGRYKIWDSIRLQAVATDKENIFAIGSNTIIKFSKQRFKKLNKWAEASNGPITHLNSGVVINGKLYCAHSNFPKKPMLSSIEIFDSKTLKHIGTHSFGFADGSATWIDWKGGYWWVAFANYGGKHSSEGRDNKWTKLVKYTKDWKQVESWAYPQEILNLFGLYSNSGGCWNQKGELYITGHDRKEIYVMSLPESGSTLRHLRTIETINAGQGFSIEKVNEKEVLYGISKEEKAIIKQAL